MPAAMRAEEEEEVVAGVGQRDHQPLAGPDPGREQPGGDAAHGIVEFGEGPALGGLRRIGIGDEDQPGLVRVARRARAEAVARHVEARRRRRR